LREIDAEHLVYESVKPGARGSVSPILTPLQLIERRRLDPTATPASPPLLRGVGAQCAATWADTALAGC